MAEKYKKIWQKSIYSQKIQPRNVLLFNMPLAIGIVFSRCLLVDICVLIDHISITTGCGALRLGDGGLSTWSLRWQTEEWVKIWGKICLKYIGNNAYTPAVVSPWVFWTLATTKFMYSVASARPLGLGCLVCGWPLESATGASAIGLSSTEREWDWEDKDAMESSIVLKPFWRTSSWA